MYSFTTSEQHRLLHRKSQSRYDICIAPLTILDSGVFPYNANANNANANKFKDDVELVKVTEIITVRH